MDRTIYQRLYKIMVKLKAADGHPAWHTPVGMVGYIALKLAISNEKTGEIHADEDTVSWLENKMANLNCKYK